MKLKLLISDDDIENSLRDLYIDEDFIQGFFIADNEVIDTIPYPFINIILPSGIYSVVADKHLKKYLHRFVI